MPEDIAKGFPFLRVVQPGTWFPGRDGRKPTITCPQCQRMSVLAEHEIAADGTVTPSVVCPDDACTWHTSVRLLDWEA